MRATFELDSCYELQISEDIPRASGDSGSVGVQVTHTPLGESTSELVFALNLKPSHARAIASALLAAATEARG